VFNHQPLYCHLVASQHNKSILLAHSHITHAKHSAALFQLQLAYIW